MAVAHDAPAPRRVTVRGVTRAEWIKLLSVRSSVVTLLVAGVLLVLLGVLFSALTGSDDAAGPQPQDDTAGSLGAAYGGINLVQLVLAVLGALVVTSEYASGLIRTMFAAVPRRLPVVAGKAIVVGGSTWVVITLASFVTFFLAQAVYSGDDPTYALTDSGVLRVVLGIGVYGTGVALMGLALGFITRSTASAVSIVIAGLLIVPGLASLLPDSVAEPITKVLPSNAGSAFTQLAQGEDLLGAGAGLAVFAAWTVGLLLVAALAVRTRDA